MERPHDTPNLAHKCYQTKDDKRHNTIWGTANIDNETPEEREERLANLRNSKGTWVYDNVQKKVVRKEDCMEKNVEIDAPQISFWDPESTVVSTGYRMSKGELKRYCKENGKRIIG